MQSPRLGGMSLAAGPRRCVRHGPQGGPDGWLPDIPHIDIPHAVLELADLPHIYPAPGLPDFDLVIGPDPDPLSTFLQHHMFSWANGPFAHPLPMLGPHAQADCITPVIDHLHVATRPIGAT